MTLRPLVALLLGTLLAAGTARADDQTGKAGKAGKRPVKPSSATPILTIKPERGFIDTPLAFDGAGGRLAYLNADAGALMELVVLDVATRAEVLRVALPATVAAPTALAFVGEGDRFLVVSRVDESHVIALVVDGAGKVLRKLGPASEIELVTYDDHQAAALYRRTEVKKGLRHAVEVIDLATGKRLGKRRELATDLDLKAAKLEFRINHWLDGHTVAVGVVGGEYDRQEDQRAPDAEAWYDVPRGVFARRVPITDVLGHARLRGILARASGERVFARISDDLKHLERVADGAIAPIALAEPLHHYDPKSLSYRAAADGTLWVALTIDPVHPDAAAQKRAVPVRVDLYQLAPGATRAERRARLAPGREPGIRWQATAQYWAVVPRHVGFERGGPELRIYQLAR